MKIWIILLLSIVFISGCVAQEVTVSDLANKPTKYVDQRVSVEGKTKVVNTMCTTIFCSEENPCCNTCAGHLALAYSGYEIFLFGEYNQSRTGCEGSECSINCHPLKAGKNYRVTGTWKKGAFYFIEIESFEEL
ncbi:MAG: hypothetical protein ISS36_02505 [Candidatus Aenigmarchaeota archaeon]|nr:hypothetical protein [Candidatus Aenigmarchaeota archaeon]